MRASLWEEFSHSFATHSERVAVRMGASELTFAEVDAWSGAIAEQLAAAGVGRGDCVALYTHNCIDFVVADVAVARLGAVKVPVNFMLPPATIAYMLERSGARALIYSDRLAVAVGEAVGVRPGMPCFQCGPASELLLEGAHPLAAFDGPRPDAPSEGAAGAAAPAAMYFTGGTTGHPKGVLHTQASTVALHYAQMLEAEITDGDRLLLMTPLAHAAGLFAQTALIRGATTVLSDGFDAEAAVDLLAEEEITWTFLVPTMLYRVLDRLAESAPRELPLRTVVYGAAPISPNRLAQALEAFGPVFIQLYAQTECPNWGTRLTKRDHDLSTPDLLGSCGRASIMADVKVVDESGRTLGAGETGEVCLRSPYTLQEYVGDLEATRAKFLDDWIRTGDVGVMDEAGYLYLKDRKNDMVISGGMNVYCREVEDVMIEHEHVHAVAVIGIPHDDWGEAVHACVVRADDGLTDADLIRWSRARLAAYATPKTVEFVESLPETPLGKIDKKALRAPYWEGRSRAIG
jgi:fatty-acyl-CoA synthase/long-chain acyl-CoA synthetase